MIKSIADLPIEGRRVFIRVDFNVPLTPAKGVADDSRIRASLPTIEHAVKRGARVVLASHLGRPKGPTPGLSLEPVGARLAELLGKEVLLTDEAVGDGARKVVADLRDGEVALLENLRFFPGEEGNDEAFARQLASYADVYVNDAFGTAHRAHASTAGMVPFVPDKGAGLLMIKEIEFLGRLLGDVERPYLAVVGGAKVSDKIGVIEQFLETADRILVGGAMCFTFFSAQGIATGDSMVEEGGIELAVRVLERARASSCELMLPVDLLLGRELRADTERRQLDGVAVPHGWMGLDIGPRTGREYAAAIAPAGTVFWNGPMGLFELEPFAAGTRAVAEAVAAASGMTVVGGGDSAAALASCGLADRVDWVSTGGGASLELMEGRKLPGVEALMDAPRVAADG
jgi:phosphoglycerate kinase